MMIGQISQGYPVIAVPFQLPEMPAFELEFVIDTGFAGYLTLPVSAVEAMNLPFFYRMPANLANDSDIMVSVYQVTVRWQGELRRVEVIAMGKRPLIGRALLAGQYLGIRFEEGSELRIEP